MNRLNRKPREKRMKFGLFIGIALLSFVCFVGAFLFDRSGSLASVPAGGGTAFNVDMQPMHAVEEIPVPGPAVVKKQTEELVKYATYFQQPAENLFENRLTVENGDTLITMLQSAGAERMNAFYAVKALGDVWDPKDLKTGQELSIISADPDDEFQGFFFRPDPETDVLIYKSPKSDSDFKAEKMIRPLTKEIAYAGSSIDSSLFEAGNAANVPVSVLIEMIRAFSYDIDFQRDLHAGDQFELLYERYVDADGIEARVGNMLFATLKLKDKEKRIYRYNMANGYHDYFDRNGQSIQRALLRTPIDNVRVSSGFGMRFHPVLGYTKMHKGIDFAAPIGTPILAAGNGIIEQAGSYQAYGNYLRIRHNSEYSTAYGHISRFPATTKVGTRVKQGQVVAYSGNTGRSTGPHLHYEVLVKGVQINPAKMNLPTGETLYGQQLKSYKSYVAGLEVKLAALRHAKRPVMADIAVSPDATGSITAPEIR